MEKRGEGVVDALPTSSLSLVLFFLFLFKAAGHHKCEYRALPLDCLPTPLPPPLPLNSLSLSTPPSVALYQHAGVTLSPSLSSTCHSDNRQTDFVPCRTGPHCHPEEYVILTVHAEEARRLRPEK